MSTGRRAYDILRGYVNAEWDRINGSDSISDAERELNDALENPVRPSKPTVVDADYRFLTDSERARKDLGVGPEATFAEIRASFDRITKRTDPANFPAGSEEARMAEEIHRRVHRAYTHLTEGMDSTEKRFRSLEID